MKRNSVSDIQKLNDVNGIGQKTKNICCFDAIRTQREFTIQN